MFTCRDATSLLTEETERSLRGWLRAKMRFHLAICSHCGAYRRQMNEAIGLAKETRGSEVSSAVEDSAIAAFRRRGADVPQE